MQTTVHEISRVRAGRRRVRSKELAMSEERIKALVAVEDAAIMLMREIEGNDLSPSLGALAKLADALHASWKARDDR